MTDAVLVDVADLPPAYREAVATHAAFRGTAVEDTAAVSDGERESLTRLQRRHVDRWVKQERKRIRKALAALTHPDRAWRSGDGWDEGTFQLARDAVRLVNTSWASADQSVFLDDVRREFLAAAPRDTRWDLGKQKWGEAARALNGEGYGLSGPTYPRRMDLLPFEVPETWRQRRDKQERRVEEARVRAEAPEPGSRGERIVQQRANLEGDPDGLRRLDMRLAHERGDAAFRAIDAPVRPSFDDAGLTFADLVQMPDPEPLVEGIVYLASLAFLVGESGLGKSFLLLHMALAIACGEPFHDKPTVQRRVLYVAAEGAGGMGKRVRAASAAWGLVPEGDDLLIWPRAVDFSDPVAVEELRAFMAARGYGVLIVDTLARTMGTFEENSATGMGQYVAAVLRATDGVPDATAIVVHHTGKDVGKGMRGSSANYAAADTVLELSGSEDAMKLEIVKQKDGREGLVGRYRRKVKPEFDSAIIEGITAAMADTAEAEGMPTAERALELFVEHFGETGAAKREFHAVLLDHGISRSTAYGAINRLVNQLQLAQHPRTGRLTLVPPLQRRAATS